MILVMDEIGGVCVSDSDRVVVAGVTKVDDNEFDVKGVV